MAKALSNQIELRSRIIASGIHYEVVRCDGDGVWHLFNLESGELFPLSPELREQLKQDHDIAVLSVRDDPDELREELDFDWETDITEAQRSRARYRRDVLRALDEIAKTPQQRRLKVNIDAALAVVAKAAGVEPPNTKATTVRAWDDRWIQSGRRIKSQVALDYKKGNRTSGMEYAWIREIAEQEIDDRKNKGRSLDIKDIDRVVEAKVKLKAEAEGLPLRDNLSRDRSIGIHLIRTIIGEMDYQTQQSGKLKRKEARQRSSGKAKGPRAKYSLHEVEIDHTPMDIMVKRPGKKAGRPHITIMIDRYSRYIIGFYLTFDPPSWHSVAMALRMGVQPKDRYLASIPYPFMYRWVNSGAPDKLFMDRAPEFQSGALSNAARDMNISLKDLPKARGDLKGKVERLVKTIQREVCQALPGYTGPIITERDEELAVAEIMLADLEKMVAAVIVDRYHQRRHTTTGRLPQEMYLEGLSRNKLEKLPPDPDILGALTAPVFYPTLSDSGIQYETLTYWSEELHDMWIAAGGNHGVIARPDPDNADVVLVRQDRGKWIEAYLTGQYAGQNLSHSAIKDLRGFANEYVPNEEESLKQRRAELQVQRAFDEYHKAGKPQPKPKLDKPVMSINRPREDPQESANQPKGWHPDREVEINPYGREGHNATLSLSERALAEIHRKHPASADEVEFASDSDGHDEAASVGANHVDLGGHPATLGDNDDNLVVSKPPRVRRSVTL